MFSILGLLLNIRGESRSLYAVALAESWFRFVGAASAETDLPDRGESGLVLPLSVLLLADGVGLGVGDNVLLRAAPRFGDTALPRLRVRTAPGFGDTALLRLLERVVDGFGDTALLRLLDREVDDLGDIA